MLYISAFFLPIDFFFCVPHPSNSSNRGFDVKQCTYTTKHRRRKKESNAGRRIKTLFSTRILPHSSSAMVSNLGKLEGFWWDIRRAGATSPQFCMYLMSLAIFCTQQKLWTTLFSDAKKGYGERNWWWSGRFYWAMEMLLPLKFLGRIFCRSLQLYRV